MTPGVKSRFTYPAELKEEITKVIGEYVIDASEAGVNLRQMNKFQVLKKIYQMDQQRFDLLKYFIKNKNCDFIFVVIMGTDRISHLFYRYFDEKHIRYTPHLTLKNALKEHYKFCDKNIGEIMDLIDEDTSLVVLSGHSTQRLDGRINLNEWLIQEGYMQLSQRPKVLTPLIKADINWKKTRAWATGYTGQIYLNMQG
jgi:predicted AlkP superfamily phosphohydrolase/phosphomutase